MQMNWNVLYDQSRPPAMDVISRFVNSGLWEKLNIFLRETYRIEPKLSYSRCSMQPSWNVKYQKSGRSLCTLYPMEESFIALVVIGSREVPQVELVLASFSIYTQALYDNTAFSAGGRWLMLHVTDCAVLNDVMSLIRIRKKSK